MAARILVKASHETDLSVKKRVAINSSDSWDDVLAKLQTKFALPGLPSHVMADGAAVEAVEELCDGDLLIVHGGTAANTAPAVPTATHDAAEAFAAFYQANKLHTAALLDAVRLVAVFLRKAAERSEPKYRRVNFGTRRAADTFGEPIRGVKELFVALGYADTASGGAGGDPPVLALPDGVSLPRNTLEACDQLERELLPYVMHVSRTAAGAAAVTAVRSGVVRGREGNKDAGGALRTEAARGGADAMERLRTARDRIAAVAARGREAAAARDFRPPAGIDRAFADVHRARGDDEDEDDEEEGDDAATASASASASAAAASSSSSSSQASKGAMDREELLVGMSLFRHLAQASSGRGRLEEQAMRLERRAEQAEAAEQCRVRLDLPDGRRVAGTFALDEPLASVARAASELMGGAEVQLRGAGGSAVDATACLADAGGGGRLAFRVVVSGE